MSDTEFVSQSEKLKRQKFLIPESASGYVVRLPDLRTNLKSYFGNIETEKNIKIISIPKQLNRAKDALLDDSAFDEEKIDKDSPLWQVCALGLLEANNCTLSELSAYDSYSDKINAVYQKATNRKLFDEIVDNKTTILLNRPNFPQYYNFGHDASIQKRQFNQSIQIDNQDLKRLAHIIYYDQHSHNFDLQRIQIKNLESLHNYYDIESNTEIRFEDPNVQVTKGFNNVLTMSSLDAKKKLKLR